MSIGEEHVAEEVVGLTYHFLPPDRLREVDAVIRALEDDTHLEFMLAVLAVTLNDRPLSREHTRNPEALLSKLLQTLEEADGSSLLYASPYNDLGVEGRQITSASIEPWNFDLAPRPQRLPELRSVRMFLEYGSGTALGRRHPEATALHDRLLRGLVGKSQHFYIWGCTLFQTLDPKNALPCQETDRPQNGLWPERDISPWFYGVFWDDLLFVINLDESTLTLLALTST